MDLSVVVPVHNEELNVEPLLAEIRAALEGVADYEVVVVDDGSTDATPVRLGAVARGDPRLRVVRHARNCGQSTALHTGVRFARASVVATLDGDGQDDPAEIPRLCEAYHDPGRGPRPRLVIGHRRTRNDSAVRKLSSRIANGVRARVLRDDTPDTGCGLKVFDRELFLAVPYFDHMHRFLPALVIRQGGQVISVPVTHRPRQHGRSHYGVHDRLWTGIVDMLGMMWLARRAKRPAAVEVSPSRQETRS
jgi:dolichol-phosphate mannosyltransferase